MKLSMFLAVMVIPAVMILRGWIMKKYCLRKMNSVLGYRTARSMKNEDTWYFGNLYGGIYGQFFGWMALLISTLVMLSVINRTENQVGQKFLVVCIMQCIVWIEWRFLVNYLLSKKFHKDGRRVMLFGSKSKERMKNFKCGEMQYCRKEKGAECDGILSLKELEEGGDDALYIAWDDDEQFRACYGKIFKRKMHLVKGIHFEPEQKDNIQYIAYCPPEKVEELMEEIKEKTPLEYEKMLAWLAKAREYNGIYHISFERYTFL